MINQNRPNAFRAIWDLFLSTLSSFFKPRHPVFVINNHPYQVISNLGQGGFSVVYLCKHKDQIHAVKRIRLSDSDEHRVQSEVDILTNIKHENIMNLIEAQILHDEAFLVCEFYAGKSAQDLISRTIDKTEIPIDIINSTILDVAAALIAIHAHSFAFRDITPSNIVYTFLPDSKSSESPRAVLIDFGSAAPISIQTVTAPFRPPEFFDVPLGLVDGKKTDVWSFGCTIYALMYLQPPFDGTLSAALSTPAYPLFSQPELMDLVKRMIKVDPASRIGVEDVIKSVSNLDNKLRGESMV